MSIVFKSPVIISSLLIMTQKIILLCIGCFSLMTLLNVQSIPLEEQSLEPKRVKLILRDIGHELLLSSNDSTTRVSPIKELDEGFYQISFEKELEFEPNNLVDIIEKRFEVSGLTNYYFVEVLTCETEETAYSFEIAQKESMTIVPCDGRTLPLDCYLIQISLGERTSSRSNFSVIIYGSVGIASLLVFFFWFKKSQPNQEYPLGQLKNFGASMFSLDQLKIIHDNKEIILSKKECEILNILIENLNKVTTRAELVKRVWEDQGVVVGRSLDTYISKLRKKLKPDSNLKLSNVHGVGYKLEEV